MRWKNGRCFLKLSAKDIYEKISKTMARGYRREEVDAFRYIITDYQKWLI